MNEVGYVYSPSSVLMTQLIRQCANYTYLMAYGTRLPSSNLVNRMAISDCPPRCSACGDTGYIQLVFNKVRCDCKIDPDKEVLIKRLDLKIANHDEDRAQYALEIGKLKDESDRQNRLYNNQMVTIQDRNRKLEKLNEDVEKRDNLLAAKDAIISDLHKQKLADAARRQEIINHYTGWISPDMRGELQRKCDGLLKDLSRVTKEFADERKNHEFMCQTAETYKNQYAQLAVELEHLKNTTAHPIITSVQHGSIGAAIAHERSKMKDYVKMSEQVLKDISKSVKNPTFNDWWINIASEDDREDLAIKAGFSKNIAREYRCCGLAPWPNGDTYNDMKDTYYAKQYAQLKV